MEPLAVLMMAVFTVGYLVLAGADLGVGMVLPWLGRDQRERRLVIASFAPFFLGNEVWLVSAAGIAAGAFPGLEHRLLEGLYPLFVVLLVGWVVRDMGLWLRGRVDGVRWRGGCDGAVVAGSWLVALAWASVFGSVLFGGVGLNAGSVVGLPLAGLFVLHGAAFAGLRLTGAPAGRAGRFPGQYPATAAVLVAVPVVAGLRLPWSEMAAPGMGLSVTAVVAVVMLPLLVGAQALVWWTFRGRVRAPSYL